MDKNTHVSRLSDITMDLKKGSDNVWHMCCGQNVPQLARVW